MSLHENSELVEIIEKSTQERVARVNEMKAELIGLYDAVTDVEHEYGSDVDSFPEPIKIKFMGWIMRATEIKEEMTELRESKKLDEMYSSVTDEIDSLTS